MRNQDPPVLVPPSAIVEQGNLPVAELLVMTCTAKPSNEKRLKERQSCPTATHSRLDESQCRGKNQTLIVEESGVWTQGFSSLKLL